MLNTLLFFKAYDNSFSHLSQGSFSYEAKVALTREEHELDKVVFYNNFYNVFHLRSKNNELMSNVYINKNEYFGKDIKYDVFEIYSVYTSPKFRRQHLAKQILFRSVKKLMEVYNIENPILVLHLNTEDPMMHIVFSFYINIGFHTACYVDSSPEDMKYSMSDTEKFFSFREVLEKPVTGKHLTLFAMNGFNYDVQENLIEIGSEMVKRIKAYIKENKNCDNNVY